MMKLLIESAGVVDLVRPGSGAIEIAEAGFSQISMDLGRMFPLGSLEATGSEEKRKARREVCPNRASTFAKKVAECPESLWSMLQTTLDACLDNNLRPALLRVPNLPSDEERADLEPLFARLVRESISICGGLNCPYLVVPPYLYGTGRDQETKALLDLYIPLAPLAKEYGIMILLENQPAWFNHRPMRGPLSDPVRMAEWIDRLNSEAGEERFGLCLNNWAGDVCRQNLREYIAALGSHVKTVQVNGGDLRVLFCALREINFDGSLIFYAGSGISTTMRPSLLKLAHETAEYYAWQINLEKTLRKYSSIALFGAGNMLRNYMYCYGKQFPPLCACDNNPSRWGHEIHGVTVYPPEKLLELPPDCGIFICNMYYREIEEQLKAMGIERIERFSDEYLPRYPLK